MAIICRQSVDIDHFEIGCTKANRQRHQANNMERSEGEFGWFRRVLEHKWAYDVRHPRVRTDSDTLTDNAGHPEYEWLTPLSELEIASIEAENGFKFQPQHRRFLSRIHGFTKNGKAALNDWRSVSRAKLDEAMEGIWKAIEFDIVHNFWWNDWGDLPETPELRVAHVRRLFDEAPKLIPVFGHRYAFSASQTSCPQVISIVQTDAIVYGDNFFEARVRERPLR